MAKIECPKTQQSKPFTSGIKLGDYYYLIDEEHNRLIKAEINSDDGVLLCCDNTNEYIFYNDELITVTGTVQILGTIDIAAATGGHQIYTTDDNIIITSYNETGTVGIQLISSDLEIIAEYNYAHINSVNWDGNNTLYISTDTGIILVFDNYLNYIKTITLPTDDSQYLYLEGDLWTANNDGTVYKRSSDNPNNILATIKISSGKQSIYSYQDDILIITQQNDGNTTFTIIDPETGAIINTKTQQIENIKKITVINEYIYITQNNGDITQINNNLDKTTTKTDTDTTGTIDLDHINKDECKQIKITQVQYKESNYKAYTYRLWEDIKFGGPKLNLKINFKVLCTDGNGFQEWYPCGSVWIALGSHDSLGDINKGTWLWTGTIGPYMVFGDVQDFNCNLNKGEVVHMGVPVEDVEAGFNTWCITDLLWAFGIWRNAGDLTNFKVRYIHVHIRTNSTIFWRGSGYPQTFINRIKACKGIPKEDYCNKF